MYKKHIMEIKIKYVVQVNISWILRSELVGVQSSAF